MSVINTSAKEIHCKIIYYGPEGSGKKSSLFYIQSQFKDLKKEFFTLPFKKPVYVLILQIGEVFGLKTFFHIYNLNNESRQDNKKLFTGADGVLFLANSHPQAQQQNIDSFLEMESFLKNEGQDLFKFPLVLQYNKRDLKTALPVKDLRLDLNKYNSLDFKSSVLKKQFIIEPLKQLCKLSLNSLKNAEF